MWGMVGLEIYFRYYTMSCCDCLLMGTIVIYIVGDIDDHRRFCM
jgi:hypothetical protein